MTNTETPLVKNHLKSYYNVNPYPMKDLLMSVKYHWEITVGQRFLIRNQYYANELSYMKIIPTVDEDLKIPKAGLLAEMESETCIGRCYAFN